MMKLELIKKYGNDLIAYDATDFYKPLVICYLEDETVLIYNVMKDAYSKLRVETNCKHSFFTYQGRRFSLSDFVNVNSAWSSGFNKTIAEYKEHCNS